MTLNQQVESLFPELLTSLQGLIKIKSVENLGENGLPFGQGVHDCLLYSLELSKKLGFEAVNVDNMCGYLEAGPSDAKEMIAVLAHLDVVPEGDGWLYPPYSATIADGKLYGRGSIDNKGPLVAAMYAMKAISMLGLPLKRRVRIIFGLNEETGSLGIKHYVDKGEELPVMGFTPDAEYPIINGEKGIFTGKYLRKFTDGSADALVSIDGGIASNVVPDIAIATFTADKLDSEAAKKLRALKFDGISIEENGDRLIVKATGKNAHGSRPEDGVNAIGKLFIALDTLLLPGEFGAFTHFMAHKLGLHTRGRELLIAMCDEISGDLTLNLGTISGNGADGVTFAINIRYPVTRRLEEFKQTLDCELIKAGAKEVSVAHKKGIYMPPSAELIKKLSRVYEEQTGEKTELISIGGGTYAKAMPNIVAFGPLFPGDDMVEHKPDEHITLDKLRKNAQIIAAAIYELAK